MPVDFSHYSVTTATMVAAYVATGGQPYDEMLLEAYERLDPQPLCPADHQAIVKLLRRERGRPTVVGRDRQALAGRILGVASLRAKAFPNSSMTCHTIRPRRRRVAINSSALFTNS